MRVALTALRRLSPARIVVAVPVAPRPTLFALEPLADETVCLATPEPFYAVGTFYDDFGQASDQEVRESLALGELSRQAF
jgi:putative phosphoribosyl transferase